MKHRMLFGLSGGPAVVGGFVGPFGCTWFGDNVQSLSGSARIVALEHSLHPTQTTMRRHSHDRETPEQILSTAIATDDCRDPRNKQCVPVAIAFARRHPQDTHAHATSCGMCSSAVSLMDVDWGTLARIDRRILAGLGSDEAFRMLRVPATGAKWSTWKRYCDAVGVSMRRAVAMLMDRELLSVFGAHTAGEWPVFAQQAIEELANREARIEAREHEVDIDEARMRERSERLQCWEDGLDTRELRAEFGSKIG